MLYDVNVNRGTFTVSRSEYMKQIHERMNRHFGEKYDALVREILQKAWRK